MNAGAIDPDSFKGLLSKDESLLMAQQLLNRHLDGYSRRNFKYGMVSAIDEDSITIRVSDTPLKLKADVSKLKKETYIMMDVLKEGRCNKEADEKQSFQPTQISVGDIVVLGTLYDFEDVKCVADIQILRKASGDIPKPLKAKAAGEAWHELQNIKNKKEDGIELTNDERERLGLRAKPSPSK